MSDARPRCTRTHDRKESAIACLVVLGRCLFYDMIQRRCWSFLSGTGVSWPRLVVVLVAHPLFYDTHDTHARSPSVSLTGCYRRRESRVDVVDGFSSSSQMCERKRYAISHSARRNMSCHLGNSELHGAHLDSSVAVRTNILLMYGVSRTTSPAGERSACAMVDDDGAEYGAGGYAKRPTEAMFFRRRAASPVYCG